MARQMKDSGVEWLGEIPKSYNVRRIKHLGNYHNGLTYTPNDLVDDDEKGTLVLRSSNVQQGRLCLDDNVYVSTEIPDDMLVKRGDIIICSRNGSRELVGKCAIIENDMRASFGAFMMIFRCDSPKYMYYVLNSGVFKYYLNTFLTSTINQLTGNNFGNMKVVVPPLDEQQRIAAFLDDKCARIDSVVEKTRASIEEYRKLKQAIITRAVTKGIRPNRPTKDSGVDWLGDIPADWELSKIKHNFTVYSGATPKSEVAANWDGNIIWITPADYKTTDRYVSQGKRNISATGYNSCGTTLVPKGNIIFSKRAPIGTVAMAAVELCTNQGCLSCVPKADTDSGYYCYFMSAFTEQFNLYGTGTTFKEISYDVFCAFKVPRPPLDEQQEIADYLDKKTAAIDSLVAKKNRLVSELESLKKSLIFEYVTGKKEVPK